MLLAGLYTLFGDTLLPTLTRRISKSTVAVKLAKHLADKKKNVVLLLFDMTAPMLPYICPPSDLESEHSLGSILAATHDTDSLIQQNCITYKKMSYLTIIGILKGENEYTYPPHSADHHPLFSCEATYRRMVTLCKRKYDINSGYLDIDNMTEE